MSDARIVSRRDLLLAGALAGAFGLGLPIALATVFHNRWDGPPVIDALVLGLAGPLLYGAAGCALAAVCTFGRRRALGAALWLLLGSFALGFFLHGLTYDQVPFGPPAQVRGMVGFLALAALAILAAAALIAWGLRRALARAAATLGWRGAAVAWTFAALAAGALALLQSGPPSAVVPASSETVVVRGGAARVALIGLDGADWRVLRPLLDRGETPNFARLVADGVSGPLATIPDSNSPVIWASIYTGKSLEQHRILDFFRLVLPGMRRGVFPVHRTYLQEIADRLSRVGAARLRPISRLDLAAVPIWEIADHLGIPTGLVDGYYFSFPAPRFTTPGGYAVAYGTDGFWQQVRAPDGGRRIADAGLFVQPQERLRDIRDHLDGADFDWQSRSTLALLDAQPAPRFLSVYTHEPDTVQHLEWKWYEPGRFPFVRAEDVSRRGGRIAERYRAFDRFLGELRQRLGPEAAIVVVSDHGHSPTILHPNYYSQHRHGPPGIFLAAGGPFRRGAPLAAAATIYDVFPTVLHLLGLPVPADAQGRVLESALTAASLDADPPRRISSYQGRWPAPVGGDGRSGLEEEELEKLRALGYL